ncbi:MULTISPECIES: hypothetical protein [unclassified Streptomyces]|uniref:hypothetical protein n=1 Tax=unclassified Streptomyces TaxID=2593676 RepID=UPI00214B6752|nr:hypothetical protein [Streptomyces sp. NBC_00162]UUU44188.1 hypothetical protein JIW86_38700 [Streptomyces sp. NBC_00162]
MTTSARPSRRGLIGTVLLVAIVIAAVLSWQWWDRSQEGEFSSDPKFCELVASETIHRLVPESYGGREDIASCTWAAPCEKGKYRAGVHLFASRLIVDLAREDMREMRANDELGWEKDTVEDLRPRRRGVPPLPAPTPGTSITAQVTFRRSNLVVSLAYTRSDDDRQAARAGAIDAARDTVARLRP